MKRTRLSILAAAMVAIGTTSYGVAETIETDWLAHETRSAIGILNDVFITAATSSDSEFASIIGGRFAGEEWNTIDPLSAGADSLVVGDANPGDTHTFVFTKPISDVLLYIENFDSNSQATIKAEANVTLELVASSESISFSSTSPNEGVLSTLNGTSNGEGDLILRVIGKPASLSIDFTAGEGANGVFYTFAQSVPEPTSGLALAVGLVLVTATRMRRLNPSMAES